MSTTTSSPRVPTSLRTLAGALALAAAVLAVVAMIMALVALQGSATAAPAPTPAAAAPEPCTPIRIAPDDRFTRAGSMAGAVAALRLAAPGREIEVLDLSANTEAHVRVRSDVDEDGDAGARFYYKPRKVTVLTVPLHDSATLFLARAMSDHVPACEAEGVMSG